MCDAQEMLASNLIESLKQIHQYIVVGLGTSVSALALSLADSQRNVTEARSR